MSNMKKLSKYAFARISSFDLREFRKMGCRNRIRFYKYLVRRGQDMEVHAVAVKTRKDGTIAMKEVVRSSVDDPYMWLRDIVLVPMAGYQVDFSVEKAGYKHYWSYKQWSSVEYTRKSPLFKLYGPTVNPEALRGLKRFKWCSYNENCGDILDFLKTYVEHPRIELLAKAGVGWYSKKPSLIKKLEKNKQFMAFFAKNIDAIKEHFYKCDEIMWAYKKGLSLGEAKVQIDIWRSFRGLKLPSCIDQLKAAAFAKSKRISREFYCVYLNNCIRLGLDLGDTKVSFPRMVKARAKIMADQCAVLDRRAKAALARKMDADISAVSAKLTKLEALRGSLRVVLPRKEKDFLYEGKTLKHCVWNGTYSARMARGESVIAFIRKANRINVPFVTVEFVPGEVRARQCYGRSGSRPDNTVLKFVNERILATAKAIAKRSGATKGKAVA